MLVLVEAEGALSERGRRKVRVVSEAAWIWSMR